MPDVTPHAGFACPDLTTFCRLDELGLEAVGQRLEPDRAVVACRVVEPDQWCRRRGREGTPRDTVTRRLAHEPLGWRPTTLEVVVRRYRCTGCRHVWRQDTTLAGDALDRCRRRVQQAIHGHRGRKSDPLYSARRTLHTGANLLTDKQKDRLPPCSPTTPTSRSRPPGASTSERSPPTARRTGVVAAS